MNKQQLITAVANTAGITTKDAATAVDTVLDTIARAVIEGDTVQVTGFGTFQTVTRQARLSRNPQTGGQIHVPATTVVRFRPGQRLKELVDGSMPLPATGLAIGKAPRGSVR